MTVTMSLLLLVLLSMLAVCIQSARTVCARVQAANSIDVGLYSLFSEYDKELLEEYQLFFFDGSYGPGSLNISQIVNQTEHYMNPVLKSGLTRGTVQACAVDGCRLASDEQGEAAAKQMAEYIKNHLGSAGIEALKSAVLRAQETMEQQSSIRSAGMEEADVTDTEPMEEISENNNPLEIINSIRNRGFLGLVLPPDVPLSEKIQDRETLLSVRNRQAGFGTFVQQESSVADKWLIQEYVLEKLGNFTEKKREGSLDYQTEYVLGGKEKDRDNLKYVVNRLLLIRETANLAYLYTDGAKRAELEACASALSLLLLIPEGMALVQAALAAGWAYIESLSDVRILLMGGRVPLIKDHTSWKTQLGHLTIETSVSDTHGMNYKEYLRILLSFSSKKKLVWRCMDMIEQNMRKIPGKENFSFDVCVDAVSMSFQIKGPEEKVWQAERIYSYSMQ